MWLTAKQDLRILLSDGPTDRYNYRKQVLGEINGSNKRFKTFDFRRVTNFTQMPGVFLNGNLLATSAIFDDNLFTGEFLLVTAPVDGNLLEASYYTQWFLDAELDDFLNQSSRWLFSTADYTIIPDGLIPSALKYAAAESYLKMAQRWRDYTSSFFKVEDAPNQQGTAHVDSFIKMAQTFREEALKSRDEYYTRQGQSLQPLHGSILGSIRSMP